MLADGDSRSGSAWLSLKAASVSSDFLNPSFHMNLFASDAAQLEVDASVVWLITAECFVQVVVQFDSGWQKDRQLKFSRQATSIAVQQGLQRRRCTGFAPHTMGNVAFETEQFG